MRTTVTEESYSSTTTSSRRSTKQAEPEPPKAPTVSQALQDVSGLNDGDRLILEAAFSGDITGCKWTRDGEAIVSDDIVTVETKSNRSKLVIQEALFEDSGTYQCVATSAGGDAKTSCKVSIKSKDLNFLIIFVIFLEKADVVRLLEFLVS